MIDPRNNTAPKSARSVQPESPINAGITLVDSAVQARAYHLYEVRGRIEGRADQDWYQAENDLRARKKQA